MNHLDEFTKSARNFSSWCLTDYGEATTAARTALSLLIRLYSHALTLQDSDCVDHDINGEWADDQTWNTVFKNAGSLPFNYYSTISNPQIIPHEGSEVGDIADDIADIFRDLSEGLFLYDRGYFAEAEWIFKFYFQAHWGQHASAAIYALNCWLMDTGNW